MFQNLCLKCLKDIRKYLNIVQISLEKSVLDRLKNVLKDQISKNYGQSLRQKYLETTFQNLFIAFL